MKGDANDEKLINQQVPSGAASRCKSLYKRYRKKVYNPYLSISRSLEQAQDFTHDGAIRGFAAPDGFQGPAPK